MTAALTIALVLFAVACFGWVATSRALGKEGTAHAADIAAAEITHAINQTALTITRAARDWAEQECDNLRRLVECHEHSIALLVADADLIEFGGEPKPMRAPRQLQAVR